MRETDMTNNNRPEQDEVTKRLLRKMREVDDLRTQELQNKIDSVKENLPKDKQRFDIEQFKHMYDLTNDQGEYRITPERIFDLETKYYLDNPNITTMEEFAKHLNFLDAHDVN